MTKKDEILQKINKLKLKINHWNDKYYKENISEVDDLIYDKALVELSILENKYPEFLTSDSPTQKVGSSITKFFEKKSHEIQPMLSIQNVFEQNEILHFTNQLKEALDKDFTYFVEPKIDGLSISIVYKNGELVSAITRGDGFVGEDVTHNVLQIKEIPKFINYKEDIIVRGEIYINLDNFILANKKRDEQNKINLEKGRKLLPKYANPRNLAAGTIRQLDHKVVSERNLQVYFFSILFFNKNVKENKFTQEEIFSFLKKNNFKVNENSKKCRDINEINTQINLISKLRNKLNYEIDGIVIKLNERFLYDYVGQTSKFPKWVVAYKFPAELKTTKLLEIFPTVGRTGRITYNAIFNEVELLGTNVKRATLHNADYIRQLNINVGDIVTVKKAGDIIPKVIGLEQKINKSYWKEITNCPSCKEKVFRFNDEIDQYCVNKNCSAQIIESIIHFVSRRAMNIKGLSEKQIELFYEKKIINKISDLYDLKNKRQEVLSLNGFQKKSVDNLINSIEQSKNNDLPQLIFALGIRYIGEKSSYDLAKKYINLDKLFNLDTEDFELNDAFGPVKSKSISNWFSIKQNQQLIENLRKNGVNFQLKDNYYDKNHFLYEKKIGFTGKVLGISRNELKKRFINLGANFVTTISDNVDYLIIGNNPTVSKLKKVNENKHIFIKNNLQFEEFINSSNWKK